MATMVPSRSDREIGGTDVIEVFRPNGWIRGTVYAAVAFWVSVFFLLVAVQDVTRTAWLGVVFFVTFFTILGIFYNNTAIEVTRDALVVRSIASFRLVPFKDLMRIDVKPGVLQTNYVIRAKQGLFIFTNLFAGHERLLNIIVERSKLGRM